MYQAIVASPSAFAIFAAFVDRKNEPALQVVAACACRDSPR
jgi:hypothetical protein